jgi:hypothetical protein
LRFAATRAIHVIAETTAQGANMTTITDETETASASIAAEAKATKKPRVGKRAANAAPKKAKLGNKPSPGKKAPTARRGEKKGGSARDGSKTAKVLELLRRQGGVTSKELLKTTGWQPHSVRGFLSGTVGKKMGLTVTSAKGEDGERTYSIES